MNTTTQSAQEASASERWEWRTWQRDAEGPMQLRELKGCHGLSSPLWSPKWTASPPPRTPPPYTPPPTHSIWEPATAPPPATLGPSQPWQSAALDQRERHSKTETKNLNTINKYYQIVGCPDLNWSHQRYI